MKYSILGIVYIVYGVSRIFIGIALALVSAQKDPGVLVWFSKANTDTTLAGKMYDYTVMVFGVYTVMYGALLLHPSLPIKYLEQKAVQYSVFIGLGSFLIVFYTLVLYSNVKIPKNKDNRRFYKFIGLGGGISFVLIPLVSEVIAYAEPAFNTLSESTRTQLTVGGTILVIVSVGVIWEILKRVNVRPHPTLKGIELREFDSTKVSSE